MPPERSGPPPQLDTVLRAAVAIMSSKTVQKALPKAEAAPLLNVLRRHLEGTVCRGVTAAPRAARGGPLTGAPRTQLAEPGVAALAVQSIHAAVERLYESGAKKADKIERDCKDMLYKNGAAAYLLDVLAKPNAGSELAAETLATLGSLLGPRESTTPAALMEEVSPLHAHSHIPHPRIACVTRRAGRGAPGVLGPDGGEVHSSALPAVARPQPPRPP